MALEYSAHPDAEATLHGIAEASIGDSAAVVAVSHRIGRLAVGDIADPLVEAITSRIPHIVVAPGDQPDAETRAATHEHGADEPRRAATYASNVREDPPHGVE
mgnify:CR=1 FL=1